MKNIKTTGVFAQQSNITISTPQYSTITTASNNIMVSTPGGSFDISDSFKEQIEFFELCLSALGYDIKFNDFKKMSTTEKKSVLRDIKLNRIL